MAAWILSLLFIFCNMTNYSKFDMFYDAYIHNTKTVDEIIWWYPLIFQVKRGGRPKPGVWSMAMIPNVEEIPYEVDVSSSSSNTDATLEKYTCIYCESTIVGPILFKCGHGSCRSCFITHNFKRSIGDTKCRKCGLSIEPSDIVAAPGFKSNVYLQLINFIVHC